MAMRLLEGFATVSCLLASPVLLAGKVKLTRLSKSDKKITNALTYEGTDRPFVKSAGQDCKASG